LFHAPAAPRLYPLSLPDALPILTGAEPTCSAVTDETAPVSSRRCAVPYPIATTSSSWVAWGVNAKSSAASWSGSTVTGFVTAVRSEEHTSELQSRFDLVCRLLRE